MKSETNGGWWGYDVTSHLSTTDNERKDNDHDDIYQHQIFCSKKFLRKILVTTVLVHKHRWMRTMQRTHARLHVGSLECQMFIFLNQIKQNDEKKKIWQENKTDLRFNHKGSKGIVQCHIEYSNRLQWWWNNATEESLQWLNGCIEKMCKFPLTNTQKNVFNWVEWPFIGSLWKKIRTVFKPKSVKM